MTNQFLNIMRIFSQNLLNYDIPLPKNSIFRINLAWVNSLDELKSILNKHKHTEIFLDLPIGRTKPPNNKYSFDDVIDVITSNKNIRYFAISNVNSSDDLIFFINKIPKHVSIVPKIESPEGVLNIKNITDVLGDKKIIMLDHDDLFSNLIKKNENAEKFKDYVTSLTEFCQKHDVTMLRTIGVVFSDEEKRTTQYIK
jgi:citrate lyase beta subunit|tara:strand:- start:131 stop:724 length:594 start_codon:yes stop_codon:yes gene_type:complete